MKVELSGENTLALGICTRAVIFTGTGQLSIWEKLFLLQGAKKLFEAVTRAL